MPPSRSCQKSHPLQEVATPDVTTPTDRECGEGKLPQLVVTLVSGVLGVLRGVVCELAALTIAAKRSPVVVL